MLTTEPMTIVEVPLEPTTVTVLPPPEETGATNNVELLPPLPMTTTVLAPLGITEAPVVETAGEEATTEPLVTTPPELVKSELAAIEGVVSTDVVPTGEVVPKGDVVPMGDTVPDGVAPVEVSASELVEMGVVVVGVLEVIAGAADTGDSLSGVCCTTVSVFTVAAVSAV